MTPKEVIEREQQILVSELTQAVERFESFTGLKVLEIPITRLAKYVSYDQADFKLDVIIKL